MSCCLQGCPGQFFLPRWLQCLFLGNWGEHKYVAETVPSLSICRLTAKNFSDQTCLATAVQHWFSEPRDLMSCHQAKSVVTSFIILTRWKVTKSLTRASFSRIHELMWAENSCTVGKYYVAVYYSLQSAQCFSNKSARFRSFMLETKTLISVMFWWILHPAYPPVKLSLSL